MRAPTSDKITIVWVHDHRLADRLGGAQLTNKGMIDNAPDWCAVLEVYPDMVDHLKLIPDGHVLVVLNNVREFSSPQLAKLTSVPYMIYAHDFWQYTERWQCRVFNRLIRDSVGFVFLSPLHKTSFEQAWQTGKIQGLCCPPPFDLDKYDAHLPKECEGDGFVFLGEFGAHKGLADMDKWAKEHSVKIDCYGWGDLSEYLYLRDKGTLEPGQVPEFLARQAGSLVFMPADIEPFGRVSAEGVLSGCTPVYNSKVGSLSYGWQTLEDWQAALAEAPALFWDYVKGVFDKYGASLLG